MNRVKAKKIAEVVTLEDLEHMFKMAMLNITDWTERSNVNFLMTKGKSWNIFYPWFNTLVDLPRNSEPVLINAVREFGEYLPNYILSLFASPPRVEQPVQPHHEEPIFNNGLGKCKRCQKRDAVADYNQHGHFVCAPCAASLEREFENEYQ